MMTKKPCDQKSKERPRRRPRRVFVGFSVPWRSIRSSRAGGWASRRSSSSLNLDPTCETRRTTPALGHEI